MTERASRFVNPTFHAGLAVVRIFGVAAGLLHE